MELHYTKEFPVSWDELHRHARALAWRLLDAGPFTGIVAVTRGGLVPASIVARELNIRLIDTIGIASYCAFSECFRGGVVPQPCCSEGWAWFFKCFFWPCGGKMSAI